MNLNIKTFYLAGSILFLISTIGNILNLYLVFNSLTIPAIISYVAVSLIFNLLVAVVFWYMYKQTPDQTMDDKKFDMMLEDVMKENKNNHKEVYN